MKGFVISWYFPPLNSSEGLVTFKLLKASKYKHDVFTQNKNQEWSYGGKEDKLISKNINPIYSEASELDSWVKEGIDYFEKNKNKYNFIMSRSMSEKSHEMALKIKKNNKNIIWIASFGDPIGDNPYNYFYKVDSPHTCKGVGIENVSLKYLMSPIRILKNMLWNLRRYLYFRRDKTSPLNFAKLQKKVLNNADYIILNNKYQKEHMLKTCPKKIKEQVSKKIIIIPHSYDEDFYENKIEKYKNDKINISYLGHLDTIRTPYNMFQAIKRLKENSYSDYKKLNINFYGNMCEKDKVYILENELYDVIHINKPVTYFESIEIMQKSDYLLLVDANLSKYINENIFFAAKIADYLGSKTKILGITMENGASADIFRETNSIISSFSSEEIYMTLRNLIDGKFKKQETINNDKYSSKNVVKLYDELIDKINNN